MRHGVLMGLLGAVGAVSLAPSRAAEEATAYKFVPLKDLPVVWSVGDRMRLGWLDERGYFRLDKKAHDAGPAVFPQRDRKGKLAGLAVIGPLVQPRNLPWPGGRLPWSAAIDYQIQNGKVVQVWVVQAWQEIGHNKVKTIAIPQSERVYEYQSGVLVLGRLNARGRFTPSPGLARISISSFVYTPRALRIYNLPGLFLEVRPEAHSRTAPPA